MEQSQAYRTVNTLRSQNRELQLKFDNQSVVLKQTEEELKDIKSKYRKLRADTQGGDFGEKGDGESHVLRQLLKEQEDKYEQMQILKDKLQYEKDELQTEATELREKLETAKNEKQAQTARMEVLYESMENVKSVALQYEEENKRLNEIVSDLEAVQLELKESLAAKEDILGTLETEAKLIGKQKSDMTAAKRETNRNRRQLLLLADSANRVQSEMHASLLSHKQLLEELKLEYEEHTETVRAEWNMERKGKVDEIAKMKQQLEHLKLIQFEDKQQLLREQREVVKALQTQFQEYRQTAEFLFQTESKKLEDKLRAQTEKYEEEIKYIIKAKDQHFDLMMIAKDAKIMNLIEGSDLQTILIKHEHEVEQVRRSHLDDLERMRLRTEAEQREVVNKLRKELSARDLTEENLKMSIRQLEERVSQYNEANERWLEQMAQRDERHMEDLQHLQGLLQEAHEAREKLNQEKQDLRHRIVRLKFQAKGDADETLPNLVKRLSLETTTLKSKHSTLAKKYENLVQQMRSTQQKQIIQSQQLEQLSTVAKNKELELADMFQTLSKILYYRINSKFGKKATSETKRRPSKQQTEHMSFREAISTLQSVLDEGPQSLDFNDRETSPEVKETQLSSQPENISTDSASLDDERTEIGIFGSNTSKKSKKNAEPKVKVKIPVKWEQMLSGDSHQVERVDRAEVVELARGIKYLKRFQKMNAHYSNGKRTAKCSTGVPTETEISSTYEKLNSLDVRHSIHGQKDEWWKGNSLYDGQMGGIAEYDANDQSFATKTKTSKLMPTGQARKVFTPQPPTKRP